MHLTAWYARLFSLAACSNIAYAWFCAASSCQTHDSLMASCGMRDPALSDKNVRKFLFHYLKFVVGPMVGTFIFINSFSTT
jgi:hypothetical protein